MSSTRLLPTGSQTAGPFFSIGLLERRGTVQVLTNPDLSGEHIHIEGQVLDGDGVPVPDALIEIWQADAHGRYRHPADTRPLPLETSFVGYGRCGTDDRGGFWFQTIKPGRVPYVDDRLQAPHIVVTVFARGLLNHAVTRLYFADESSTAEDPILARVPPERRERLLATPVGGQPATYRFDVILQGAGETPFFNV
ncbi:MAG: protocatechuate 3,4-dioxygenase subunit alpha [Chloroflexi bacterium]|nr:protocatechuate 3,4-dioxygenase subunit alpha [Chloroflexota bacterium]